MKATKKAELETKLIEAGFSADPWIAEHCLLHEQIPASPELLKTIFDLKQILLFEAFGDDQRYNEGGEQ